jgi:hypothetical protein
MASGANAFPSRAGFNQSGGAHFIVMTSLTDSHINTLASAGSNSGGAFVNPTFGSNTAAIAFGATTTNGSNAATAAVAQGKLLKDMGRTVVSANRTFRKFAAVGTGSANFNSSFGVQGGPASAPNAGYGTFYLEVCREGNPGSTGVPAPILRYF